MSHLIDRRSVLLLGATAAGAARDAAVEIEVANALPPLEFAASEIRRALALKRIPVRKGAAVRIVISVKAGGPEEQAYKIVRQSSGGRTVYTATGAGPAGAMYAGLDIAEAIRLGTLADLVDVERTPHIAKRGIKFNIPLDARTPSYSDAGDSAQQNIPEMWSMAFWREFLDEMSRHRYNVLSLWSLHPFPSLLKVPEYPDVALDDVKRTTVRFEDVHHTGVEMGSPEIFAHLETVRRMTIAQKIKFWRDVMQYARDRSIEILLFTWNIFTWGADGKYGITWDQTNPTTIDYFRKSVRETILTYPLLAGIGITAGEHMPVSTGEFAREPWLWKTYGEGVRDALKTQPGRKFRLIHRQHQTSLKKILDEWKDLPCTFEMSYKYSVAHMYSDPKPQFARKDILGQMPAGLRVWMTVRNDDIYSFRWGDPEYARAYIRNMPGPDQLAGFYMGPDGYTWGREFISTEPEMPRELVIRKQWYSFMLWGRLSFDPTLPDSLFERTLGQRFPEVSAEKLYAASAQASKIIPRVTTFCWGDIDIKWFPEGCTGDPDVRGFYTVEKFIHGEAMPGSGVLSIQEYLKGARGMTPPEVAEELRGHAAATLELVGGMRPVKNKELRLTLGDFECMAHLGNYYAEKILGAVALAKSEQDAAVKHLRAALAHWKLYAAAATAQYKPQRLTRIGYFDLNQLTVKVEADVALAMQASNRAAEHRIVYREAGRLGGWPANYGIWQWDNEILVGFGAAWFKVRTADRHQQDPDKPEEPLQARSLDGGVTWKTEAPRELLPPAQGGREPRELTEPIDFTRSGFALTIRFLNSNTGPSLLWYTYDKGRSWNGPFRFPQFGEGVAARTDYLIDGPRAATVFLTQAKSNRREGRPFCARTTDGGLTWKLVGYVGEEPEGFAIMPSTVRLSPGRLLTMVRAHAKDGNRIDAWLSDDSGATWRRGQTIADAGEFNGNPAAHLKLRDGRLCVTWGYRASPYSMRARLSRDEGRSWGDVITIRGGGAAWDLGYPRSVQRPDGKIVTVYYFNDGPHNERFIAATIWDPDDKNLPRFSH